MNDLLQKFTRCINLNDQYKHVENAGSYFTVREGETLSLYFQWSNGKEDWRNNFDFLVTAARDSLNTAAKAYKDMEYTWRVHRGFLRVWKSVEAYVKDEILDASVKRIEIVGYSHGAALALLCHEYCKYNRPDVEVTGVGFGCPRVVWGNPSEEVLKRFEGFTVVRNGKDLVTHVPPRFFGFRHVGELKEIGTHHGYIIDHFEHNYYFALVEKGDD